MEAYLIIGLIVVLFVTLVTNVLRPALAFVLAATICLFCGWISAPDLLINYANETLLGLILLLLVSSVLERTHLLPYLSKKMFHETSLRFSLFKISSVTMLLSAFLSNTAVVAAFMGMILQNKKFQPSRLLIPLSFAAIMGGVLTLIGTSTNLIINSFVVKAGLPSLHFFDFIYIGLPLAIVGLIYLVVISPYLLPKIDILTEGEDKQYTVEADVREGSQLAGKTVKENGFRQMDHLFLTEIIRNGQTIFPVTPEIKIKENDSLVFVGNVREIEELKAFDGLDMHSGIKGVLRSNLQEVVVKHDAPIIGAKVKDAQFRTKFDAVIVAVMRGKNQLIGKIGDMQLLAGDSLVLAVGSEFEKHRNLNRNFIFTSEIELKNLLTHKQGIIAIGVFILAIIGVAAGICSLFKGMIATVLFYIAAGFVQIKHLKNSLDIGLLLMIGSSLGIATVMENYGVSDMISNGVLSVTGSSSPYLALIGIYIGTVILTEMVTNNAAAALMFPVALATSSTLGVSYLPFVMAIAYGASASFLTPIGYQTNTMVFSVGKYKFNDYIKTGAGLTVIYGILVVVLLPLFFPF